MINNVIKTPNKGDIFLAQFFTVDDRSGLMVEIKSAVMVAQKNFNDSFTCYRITKDIKGLYSYKIIPNKDNGLHYDAKVAVDTAMTIHKSKMLNYIGTLSEVDLENVLISIYDFLINGNKYYNRYKHDHSAITEQKDNKSLTHPKITRPLTSEEIDSLRVHHCEPKTVKELEEAFNESKDLISNTGSVAIDNSKVTRVYRSKSNSKYDKYLVDADEINTLSAQQVASKYEISIKTAIAVKAKIRRYLQQCGKLEKGSNESCYLKGLTRQELVEIANADEETIKTRFNISKKSTIRYIIRNAKLAIHDIDIVSNNDAEDIKTAADKLFNEILPAMSLEDLKHFRKMTEMDIMNEYQITYSNAIRAKTTAASLILSVSNPIGDAILTKFESTTTPADSMVKIFKEVILSFDRISDIYISIKNKFEVGEMPIDDIMVLYNLSKEDAYTLQRYCWKSVTVGGQGVLNDVDFLFTPYEYIAKHYMITPSVFIRLCGNQMKNLDYSMHSGKTSKNILKSLTINEIKAIGSMDEESVAKVFSIPISIAKELKAKKLLLYKKFDLYVILREISKTEVLAIANSTFAQCENILNKYNIEATPSSFNYKVRNIVIKFINNGIL